MRSARMRSGCAQPVIFELLRIEVITPIDGPDDLQTPRPAQHGRRVTVYGVYAVSGGQLHELEALAGRVPE
jgi:hypothetical protein